MIHGVGIDGDPSHTSFPEVLHQDRRDHCLSYASLALQREMDLGAYCPFIAGHLFSSHALTRLSLRSLDNGNQAVPTAGGERWRADQLRGLGQQSSRFLPLS